MTVSRVLGLGAQEGRVRKETRERVRAAADLLGYRPNVAARSLRSNRMHQIGAYINRPEYLTMAGFGWMRLFSSLQRQSEEHNYRLAFHFYEDASEASLREFFEPGRYVDGLVVQGRNLSELEIRLLRESGMPVVSLYERLEGFCCMLGDDRGMGRKAADYLYSRGHRRVAAMAHKMAKPEWNGRYEGFIDRARELGMEVVETCFREANKPLLAGWEREFGYDSVPLPGEGKLGFSAIWIPSDFVAVGAIRRYEAEGLVVGRDISVLSYDNSEAYGYAHWETPRITSFELARDRIGLAAADMLCGGNYMPGVHWFASTLVERTSVCDGPDQSAGVSSLDTFGKNFPTND